jgi:hypothetical protein
MKSTKRKHLPYGNSNFESVRTEGYAYVEKMRFIKLLKQEANDNLFLIRPRKFDKYPTPKHNELPDPKLFWDYMTRL